MTVTEGSRARVHDVEEPDHLSRTTDHLANLASQLADLTGYSSLVYELVQNADDAKAARMAFRVLADRLEVSNDASFSDCGDMAAQRCPWRAKGPACDFHSFRRVASGNKALRTETTGAFGIGFTSVYQITDHPEIVSAGRHWILDESAAEDYRIRVCKGECGRDHHAPGTLVVLPFATTESELRQALGASIVTPEDVDTLVAEIAHVVPDALLFLRHLNEIEIDADPVQSTCTRLAEVDGVIISNGELESYWRILEADFEAEATALHRQFAGLIDESRGATVRVAIGDGDLDAGLLYAGLPTKTSLPHLHVRVDAEFFPTRDRKTVHLGDDYRGQWNRSALQAAAKLIADEIETIFQVLGAEATWRLVLAAHKLWLENSRGQGEPSFGLFWTELLTTLPGASVLPTQGNEVMAPRQVVLAPNAEAQRGDQALGRIGVRLTHADLRATIAQLPFTELSMRQLAPGDIVAAFREAGLDGVWDPQDPESVLDLPALSDLLRGLESMLGARRTASVEGLDEVGLVPCNSGIVAPASAAVRIDDEETRELVQLLELPVDTVNQEVLSDLCPALLALCDPLDPPHLVALLEGVSVDQPDKAVVVLRWLNARRHMITAAVRATIRDLPLFPSAGGLRPLNELALPGGFEDPLGLAAVVDVASLDGLDDFLVHLGAEPLSVSNYLRGHAVPRIAAGDLQREQLESLLDVIADHLPRMEGDEDLRDLLAQQRLVPCTDGEVHSAAAAYFPDAGVDDWGLPQISLAAATRQALVAAYEWLGVAHSARRADIAARVQELARVDIPVPVAAAEQFVATLARHEQVIDWLKTGKLNPVKHQAWLPIKSGGRLRPESVFPTFQERIFATQGPFLALSALTQQRAADFLYAIGVPREVPPSLVVNHLRECIRLGLDVHKDVYRYLAEQELPEAALAQLRAMACIQVSAETFRYPHEVFWDESPFGRFSARLDPALRQWAAFFDKVGVKTAPDHTDAVRVLKAAASDWRAEVLDEEALAVIHACWSRINACDSVTLFAVADDLAAVPCIPDARRVLERPESLFFRDPMGLGERSNLLRNSLVERHVDTWEAYAAAGVREVADVLQTTIQLDDPVCEDDELAAHVESRRSVIRRVLEAHHGTDADSASRLGALEFSLAAGVRVQHEFALFNQVDRLEPQSVGFYYDEETHRLLRSATAPPARWQGCARELARAVADEAIEAGELASLASDLLHVLTSSDAAEAEALLDDLGVPLLDETATELPEEQTVGDLGGLDEDEPASDEAASQLETPDAGRTTGSSSSALDLLEGVKDIASDEEPDDESGGTLGDEGNGGRGSGGGGTERQDGRGHEGRRRQSRSKPGKREVQTRMVSYVVHGEDDDSPLTGDEAPDWSEVDLAGMAAVLEYEEEQGRDAEPMEHHHPGFDVVSRDDTGEVVRRIEVKSTEGPWGTRGVAMSRRQFDESRNEASLYWLYVVEYATDDSRRRIYAIHDPASFAKGFVFDKGWASIAEETW